MFTLPCFSIQRVFSFDFDCQKAIYAKKQNENQAFQIMAWSIYRLK